MSYEEFSAAHGLTPQEARGYARFMSSPGQGSPEFNAQDEAGQPLSHEEVGQIAQKRHEEMMKQLRETNKQLGQLTQQTSRELTDEEKEEIEIINAQLKNDKDTLETETNPDKQVELLKNIFKNEEKLGTKTVRRDLDNDEEILRTKPDSLKKLREDVARLEAIVNRTPEQEAALRKSREEVGRAGGELRKAMEHTLILARATTKLIKKDTNPQFKAAESQINRLMKRLEANTGIDVNVQLDALELARLIKPFYLAEKPRIQEDMYWVPKSAEDLWLHIANHQSEEFAPGGEWALVSVADDPDIPGRKEVMLNTENIFEWLRQEILRVHEFNSTAPSDLLGSMISIRAGFTQFQIFELLWQKNYWLREVKTTEGGVISVADKEYQNIAEQLFMELWKYYFIHDSAIAYREGMGSEDKLVEALANFYNRKNLFTATRGRLRDSFCYGSTDVKTHGKNGKGEIGYKLAGHEDSERYQGTLGKASQRLKVAYGYMTESVMVDGSQQHWRLQKTDEKGNLLKKTDGTPDLYENLFEKALGKKGSEEFYRTIIRDIFTKEYGGIFSLAEELVANFNMGRKDWQQVDLLDLLFKGEEAFKEQLGRLEPRPAVAYDELLEELRQEWASKGKLEEFNRQRDILMSGKNAALRELARKGKFGIKVDTGGNFTGEFASFIQQFSTSGNDRDLRGFAVELARQVWIKDDENILNVFSHPKKGNVTQRVRDAMVRAMVKEHDLRESEVKYGEGFVFDLAFLMGDAAANDVDGIGFNAWLKWMRPKRYREGQTDFKNAFGNPANIPGIDRLSGPFAQFTKVRGEDSNEFNKSLQYYLQGGEGDDMNLDKELGIFDFRENASTQFHADHISMVATFYKNLNKIEIEFEKLIKYDPVSGATKDFAAFQQFIDNYWKPLRYAEGNADPPLKEKFRSWTFVDKLGLGYKVKRTATITTGVLEDLMVSKEVKNLGMPDLPNNILGYLISSQIALHLPPLCYRFGYKKYGVPEIEALHDLFSKASRSTEFDGQDITPILSAISEDQWERILKTARTSMWKLYLSTYGWDAAGMTNDLFVSLFDQFFSLISPLGK